MTSRNRVGFGIGPQGRGPRCPRMLGRRFHECNQEAVVTIPTHNPWNSSHLEHPREPRGPAEAGQLRKCNRIDLSECPGVTQAGQRRKCNRIDLFECCIVIRLCPQSSSCNRYPGQRSGLEDTACQAEDADRAPNLGSVPRRVQMAASAPGTPKAGCTQGRSCLIQEPAEAVSSQEQASV